MQEPLFPICLRNKWGFVNSNAQAVLDPQFYSVGKWSEGFASFTQDRKCGFVDSRGHIVCPPTFDSIGIFSEGLCKAKSGDTVGYIDQNFKFAFAHDFGESFSFHEGLVIAYNEHCEYCYLDRAGAVVLEDNFVLADCSQGMICFQESADSRCGFKDKTGIWKIQPQFEIANSFAEGLAEFKVRRRGHYISGFIDLDGQIVIAPTKYESTGTRFSESLAVVWSRVEGADKAGFINRNGELAIPCIYNNAYGFADGLAAVKCGDKFGFIDKLGSLAIPARFDIVEPFNHGLAWIKIGEEMGYVNKAGEVVYLGK